MAGRLPFICENMLKAISHDSLRHSRTVLSSCVSCALIRNSSTFSFPLRITERLLCIKNNGANLAQMCEKSNWRNSNKKKASTEYDSGSDSDDEDFIMKEKAKTEGVKVVQMVLDNLRVDGILKHAFGIARNKIEVMFYENKIRINGRRPTKKSADVNIGDEVDIVKGVSTDNKNFIIVSRVEVLRVRPSGDYLALTIRKQKNMVIENYEEDLWSEKAPEEKTDGNEELA